MPDKPKSSRDLHSPPPRKDTERDDEKARIKDADKNDGADRDKAHGDGSEIGLDKK